MRSDGGSGSSHPGKDKKRWQVAKNRIPSEDQVLNRHGLGDGKCVWRGEDEDSELAIIYCFVYCHKISVECHWASGWLWNPAGFA